MKIGTKILKEQNIRIDMVFSGINLGGNLGTDTLYSGTVSAAVEGSLCGIPSVAVSVNSHEAKHFELACDLALGVCKNGFAKMNAKTVLNINTPDLPKEEIKGVKYTRLGARAVSYTHLRLILGRRFGRQPGLIHCGASFGSK